MKTKEVIDYLDLTFRPELQEDYDNSGFLLGDENSIYRGSLVALDLTVEVIEEAIREGVNLIVTHHPLIFSGIKRITNRNANMANGAGTYQTRHRRLCRTHQP